MSRNGDDKPRITIGIFGPEKDKAQITEALMRVTSQKSAECLIARVQESSKSALCEQRITASWQQLPATGWGGAPRPDEGEVE